MMSRDMDSYGVHIVYACIMEIKEYNVRAHKHGIIALRKMHGR